MDLMEKTNITRKEAFMWGVLLLNLIMFFVNVFNGNMFFLLSLLGVALMTYALNSYYQYEKP